MEQLFFGLPNHIHAWGGMRPSRKRLKRVAFQIMIYSTASLMHSTKPNGNGSGSF